MKHTKYLLAEKETGVEFLIDAYGIRHAELNAKHYDAIIIGRLHSDCQKRATFTNDQDYDWTKHTVKYE
jgi:hypothetical protein